MSEWFDYEGMKSQMLDECDRELQRLHREERKGIEQRRVTLNRERQEEQRDDRTTSKRRAQGCA